MIHPVTESRFESFSFFWLSIEIDLSPLQKTPGNLVEEILSLPEWRGKLDSVSSVGCVAEVWWCFFQQVLQHAGT